MTGGRFQVQVGVPVAVVVDPLAVEVAGLVAQTPDRAYFTEEAVLIVAVELARSLEGAHVQVEASVTVEVGPHAEARGREVA